MDPEAELQGLRAKVNELQDRLEVGVSKIISEPDTRKRKYYEQYFVGLLREYELSVQVWAHREFAANPNWSDPRISKSKLQELKGEAGLP